MPSSRPPSGPRAAPAPRGAGMPGRRCKRLRLFRGRRVPCGRRLTGLGNCSRCNPLPRTGGKKKGGVVLLQVVRRVNNGAEECGIA